MDRAVNWVLGRLAAGGLGGPLAQERTWEWDWGWHPMWGMWGAWGIGMMVIMLLFWILVLVGFALGLRWLVMQAKGSRSDAALEVLRERYARGEIGKEEFDAKKRDLQA